MWPVHQRLRPPLPFPQPVHRPEEPPPFPPLHPLHGDCPPSFCCHGNKLPVWEHACGRSQLVLVAHAVRRGILGRGHDVHECADAPLGGVATYRAVWSHRHRNNHLLQTVWELGTTEVTGTALGHSAVVPAGWSETSGQRANKRGQNCHRHLILSVCIVSSCCYITTHLQMCSLGLLILKLITTFFID